MSKCSTQITGILLGEKAIVAWVPDFDLRGLLTSVPCMKLQPPLFSRLSCFPSLRQSSCTVRHIQLSPSFQNVTLLELVQVYFVVSGISKRTLSKEAAMFLYRRHFLLHISRSSAKHPKLLPTPNCQSQQSAVAGL